jgi:CTD small phosphatase-like protein 2
MVSDYYFSKLLQADHRQKELFNDHFELTAKSYLLASKLTSSPDSFLVQKMVYLPPNPQRKKTLILDLDETLVHCNDSLDQPYDHLINIKLADGDIIDVGVNLRPGLHAFLKQVSRLYEIVIFTASQSFYANEVLNIVDPSNELISYRLFYDHCFKSQGGHLIKDLRIIKNRHLANVVLVDNAAYSYAMQTENGVPIIPFFNDKRDVELAELSAYLTELAKAPDVREAIAQDFHVELFRGHCSEPEVLKEKIVSFRKR